MIMTLEMRERERERERERDWVHVLPWLQYHSFNDNGEVLVVTINNRDIATSSIKMARAAGDRQVMVARFGELGGVSCD